MPLKLHNPLCYNDRIDDNAVKLFKMGQEHSSHSHDSSVLHFSHTVIH